MSARKPHYLLFSEAAPIPEAGLAAGRWRFVLRSAAGEKLLEAADDEDESPERLELLAIVRGLEALDQPSRVTLVTASRSVHQGLRSGLASWRESGWHWERFGKMTPVKNADLWRRIDRALDIHQLECRCSRPQLADDLNPPAPAAAVASGRRLRFDGVHAAGVTRNQTPATKRAPVRDRQMTEGGDLRQGVIGPWRFAISSLVNGAFSRIAAFSRLQSLIHNLRTT